MKTHHPLDYTAPLPNAVALHWLSNEHLAWASAQFLAMSSKRSARYHSRKSNDVCNFRDVRTQYKSLYFKIIKHRQTTIVEQKHPRQGENLIIPVMFIFLVANICPSPKNHRKHEGTMMSTRFPLNLMFLVFSAETQGSREGPGTPRP